jgi:hypothetical protein
LLALRPSHDGRQNRQKHVKSLRHPSPGRYFRTERVRF